MTAETGTVRVFSTLLYYTVIRLKQPGGIPVSRRDRPGRLSETFRH
jgi:hypothetical protein